MFSSSLDNKELQEECPLKKDHVRTHVYLTLQKFELVKVVGDSNNKKKGNKKNTQSSGKHDKNLPQYGEMTTEVSTHNEENGNGKVLDSQ